MIKELWILIKMLFQSKPSDVLSSDELQLMEMKHFPFKKFTFMSWCGVIIFRAEKRGLIERFLKAEAGVRGKRMSMDMPFRRRANTVTIGCVTICRTFGIG